MFSRPLSRSQIPNSCLLAELLAVSVQIHGRYAVDRYRTVVCWRSCWLSQYRFTAAKPLTDTEQLFAGGAVGCLSTDFTAAKSFTDTEKLFAGGAVGLSLIHI